MLKLVLILALSVVGVMPFIVGGYAPVPVEDADVQKVAAFAVGKLFSGSAVKWEIQEAQRQVVAGLNYDLTINASYQDNTSEKSRIIVYDQFGFLQVTSHKQITSRFPMH